MRILLPTHAFPPHSTAGVEVYTSRLARALADQGHEVRVLTAVHDLAAAPYSTRTRTAAGGFEVSEVVNVHPVGTLEATYADPALRRVVGREIRDFRPDVVHAQHLLNLSAGLLAEARSTGAAVLLSLHDYWLSCPRDGVRQRADLSVCTQVDHAVCATCLRDSPYLVPAAQRNAAAAIRSAGLGRWLHRFQRAVPRIADAALSVARRMSPAPHGRLDIAMNRRADVLRRALAAADLLVAPTRFVLERTREFGVPGERLRHLPLGALVHAPRAREAGPRRRFGYVGTLAPHKGVRVLVDAFRRLTRPDVSLDLRGALHVFPGYVQELRDAAGGDPRIRFHGGFAEGGQPAVFETLDALVLPSLWWENSPLSVLEALGAGRVVVASRTGGLPELVNDGVSGLLTPPGDVAALAEALESLAGGAVLAEAGEPLPLKTVATQAGELIGLYREQRARRRSVSGASRPRASVVVPVLNGGETLPALLDTLEVQELPGGLEILAIDSGSTDGSWECLQRACVRALRIPAAEFDHGLTRNLGAREARGDVVLFLSQDAVPVGPDYARRLVEVLDADARLAGAFARQRPRPEADPRTRRDVAGWVAGVAEPRSVFASEAELLGLPPLERYRRSAFDNVASAVRRELLLAHPFEASRFGEDVEWGLRMLRLGHGLAYVPGAVVEHSHPRSAAALFRRNYLGHRTLFRLFGLRSVPDGLHLVRSFAGTCLADLVTLRRAGAGMRVLLGAPSQAWAASYGQYRGAGDEAAGRPWPAWS